MSYSIAAIRKAKENRKNRIKKLKESLGRVRDLDYLRMRVFETLDLIVEEIEIPHEMIPITSQNVDKLEKKEE